MIIEILVDSKINATLTIVFEYKGGINTVF